MEKLFLSHQFCANNAEAIETQIASNPFACSVQKLGKTFCYYRRCKGVSLILGGLKTKSQSITSDAATVRIKIN